MFVKSLGDILVGTRRRSRGRLGPYEAAMEMDMFYRLVTAGAAVCAFSLLGFAGQADATTRLTLKASPSLTILAQNSENSEVQNLLDPQSDNGVPGGPSQATPDDQPAAGGQMQTQPARRRRRDERDRPGRGQVARGGRRDGLDCFGGIKTFPPLQTPEAYNLDGMLKAIQAATRHPSE